MTLAIGQSADGRRIPLRAKRGTDLLVDFAVRKWAGVAAACARPVAGGPFVFADGVGLEARGRVTGSAETVDVVAAILLRGDSVTPGVMRLYISEGQLEKAFADGAFGEITGDVNTTLGQRATEFLSFTVDVIDSAVTGA